MPNLIQIKENSARPKYIQIVSGIIAGIENGTVTNFQKLPSINEVSTQYDVSRDTVEKAYRELKRRKYIESTPGKGYFINIPMHDTSKKKIFVLVNVMSDVKRKILNSFVKTLGEKGHIELFVYDNKPEVFKEFLENIDKTYTNYVFFPSSVECCSYGMELISQLPHEKVMFINRRIPAFNDCCSSAFQTFSDDLNRCLEDAKPRLDQYKKVQLLFPHNNFYCNEIIKGANKYCSKYQIPFEIVTKWEKFTLEAQTAFLTITDDDLVQLIRKIRETDLIVGKDVGILSYDDTPLKEVLLDGISVITTDHETMGRTAATLILENKKAHINNPCHLILRKTL
jgi:DNA-binding transcriptional regulator YhcF (GntR family)